MDLEPGWTDASTPQISKGASNLAASTYVHVHVPLSLFLSPASSTSLLRCISFVVTCLTVLHLLQDSKSSRPLFDKATLLKRNPGLRPCRRNLLHLHI